MIALFFRIIWQPTVPKVCLLGLLLAFFSSPSVVTTTGNGSRGRAAGRLQPYYQCKRAICNGNCPWNGASSNRLKGPWFRRSEEKKIEPPRVWLSLGSHKNFSVVWIDDGRTINLAGNWHACYGQYRALIRILRLGVPKFITKMSQSGHFSKNQDTHIYTR